MVRISLCEPQYHPISSLPPRLPPISSFSPYHYYPLTTPILSPLPPLQELDEAADEEVEKILFEVTKGQLGTDTAISTPIAGEADEEIAGPANVSSEEEDDLQSRLAALRS